MTEDRFRILAAAFGADLDRAAGVPAEHHAPGTGRVKLPSLEFRGSDGVVHGVYGYTDYASLAAAAIVWLQSAAPAGYRIWQYVLIAAVTALVGGIAIRTVIAISRHQLLPRPTTAPATPAAVPQPVQVTS